MSGPSGEHVLEFPAEARYVRVARLFAAMLARDAGVDEETVGDVKVAISEAATGALLARGEGGSVRVVAVSSDEEVTFRIEGFTVPGGDGFGFALITSLFPDAVVDDANGETELRFTARRTEG